VRSVILSQWRESGENDKQFFADTTRDLGERTRFVFGRFGSVIVNFSCQSNFVLNEEQTRMHLETEL